MWYLIESNKRKTAVLIFCITFLLILFGALAGFFLLYGYEAAIIGAIISVIVAIIITFYAKTKAAKYFLDEAMATPADDFSLGRVLKNITEEMAISSSLGYVPKVYIVDINIPNAFAVGINSKNAAIAVTTGLLSILNRDELQGVIAHEISHIKNQDTLYLLYAGFILGFFTTLSTSLLHSRPRGKGAAYIFILLILSLIAAFFARLLYFSISRKREFLADACACQYTRYPSGLASALNKISNYDCEKSKKGTICENEAISCMCIHNNIQQKAKNFIANMFQTHPPIEKRIEILSKMGAADIAEYNRVYTLTVAQKDLISKKNLSELNIVPLAIVGASVQADTKEEKIARRREAKNIYKVSKNFKIINCGCGTILKIPPEYKKETIICPHCNKEHKI